MLETKNTMMETIESLNVMWKDMKKESKLTSEVIDIILDQIEDYDNPKDYFEEVLNHGCISAVVPALITYKDTEEFFDRHVDEIFDLLNEIEYREINFELNRNNLAWFAFEESLNRIYNDLF